MGTILDDIVRRKGPEIEVARRSVSEGELLRRIEGLPPARDFRAALLAEAGVAVVAEVKKASPSLGVIRENFDPVAIARIYDAHGAACLSVLTDLGFQGRLSYLSAIRAAVERPLLRKDFILDRYQILEARAAGADAVLLIAEILDAASLPRLLADARSLGMQALVELYDAENLARVLDAGADLVGVNNRDLRTFTVRLEHTLDLASRMPANVCLVSESGIRTRAEVAILGAAGVRAVLVGETLMRAEDIGVALDALRGLRREEKE